VREKLRGEAVEDYRLDFEDGYGNRADAEEDGHAAQAAAETAKGLRNGTLSPFIGIRIKTLSGEVAARALRTLDIYLTALVREAGGKLPPNFVVTLPKITSPAQVSALIDAFEALEPALGLPAGSLKMEPMIEMTQTILDQDGASMLPKILRAARGRIVAAHFGTYDYTASCNITAAYQQMRHPACDFAKHMMQVAYAGTGIWLSDGATGILPVPLHRGDVLTDEQKRDNQRAVHAAWRLHADDTRHSLANGYYQGWDLHPAQLPSRYGAAYGFFLKGLPAASERLKNFVGKAAQATLVGDVFDDAATGQGLLNFFLRGVNCGALLEEEALATGLTLEELRSRSFLKILNGRRAAAQKA
jgi:citrate lyase beta subunit